MCIDVLYPFRQCLFLTNNLQLNKYGKDLSNTTSEGGGYLRLNDYYTAWSVKTTEKYSLSIKITGYEGAWSCSENRIAIKDGMNIYTVSKLQIDVKFVY